MGYFSDALQMGYDFRNDDFGLETGMNSRMDMGSCFVSYDGSIQDDCDGSMYSNRSAKSMFML